MYRRIFNIIILAVSMIVLLDSCNKDDDHAPYTFSSLVDVSGASISGHKYDVVLKFSTDGGATFIDYPKLSVGQEYMVKIVDPASDGASITSANCFVVDWSSSKPAPSSTNGGVATFVLGKTNDIAATVINEPFVAANAAGTYEVVTDDWADYGEGDQLTVEMIDATHIRVVEYPATGINHAPLVITITDLATGSAVVESQDSGAYSDPAVDEEVTEGTGTVSSCAGTIILTLDFTLPCCGSFTDNILSLKKMN